MSACTDYANRCSTELRIERARVKASLRRGHVTLAEVFDSPAVQTMKIADLLECVHQMAALKASRVLLALRIGYARPIERLTGRERLLILEQIERRHPWVKVRP